MTRFTMTTTRDGSADGNTVTSFEAGATYDVTNPGLEFLANAFTASGDATDPDATPAKPGPASNKATKPDETK
jgi:hypothetical protein